MRLGGMSEACGVVGIYAPGREAARLAFFGLYALQHRGQESAGIASADGRRLFLHKGMGLVAQVFTEENLRPLKGPFAIGHNRYSTTGASRPENAQPLYVETLLGPLALGHNGNLTNAHALRRTLLERGVGLATTSDSELILQLLAQPPEDWGVRASDHPWVDRIRALMRHAEGAYSLVLLVRDAVFGVRDPQGFRPLVLGALEGGGHVLASETAALHPLGARFVREIEPGEIVRIDAEGVKSFSGHPPKAPALCSFEYVYFARPDSLLKGRLVHQVRQRLGAFLAREAPAEADAVVGVPDSAIPQAIGYAHAAGLPYTEGFIKNRYIGRTFIEPDDRLRRDAVKLKYTPLSSNLEGRRVVLVDDSIVRGNTAGPLVRLLREAGAREVHVRVASPPVRHPCFMGLDMATRRELIAARFDPEAIARRIGADSLAYLSLEGMLRAIGVEGLCHACFSGAYPLPIPPWLFEEDREAWA